MVQVDGELLSTLPALLRSGGKADDTAVIVANGGPRLSYAELHAEVDRVAAVLRGTFGITAGSVVSMAFPNTIELVIVFLAVTRARAIAAPLNGAYKEEEFLFYMEDAGTSCLIIPVKDEGGPAEKAGKTLGIPVLAAEWRKCCESCETLDLSLTSGAVKEVSTTDGAGPLPEPEDITLFLHTSGTTSRPKGVPLTHGNLTASLKNITATYNLQPTDRTLIVMPLFHVHGLMASLLATLAAGGTIVLPAAGRFSASTFWHDIATYNVTWYTAVPTIHQILLSQHHKSPLVEYPRLRFIRSCSSPLALPVFHSLEKEFHAPVLEAYAMTEASHQMTSNPLPERGEHKPGTVGRPTGIELAVIDSDGNLVETGHIGEVCIKGPNVTKGYMNNEEANNVAFAGGWFHTGDRGFLDADGYLMLTGRIKELINRGGEKISPIEVDNALLSHTAVSEAVTFAAPDEKYGEAVNAAVVLKQGEVASPKDIIDHCKKKIAPFKVPVRVFIAASLPRTSTGKIQRRFVAEKFLKEAQQKEDKLAADEAGLVSETKVTLTESGVERMEAAVGNSEEDVTQDTRAAVSGARLVAKALSRVGVKYMFGVVGIPVTAIASHAQSEGIRYIGFHNEQSAGYAACAVGYLTGIPGALLTVSGPGCVHGLAGLSHAAVNCWPMVMLSGSCHSANVGKGDFQELDQMEAVKPFSSLTFRVLDVRDICDAVERAVRGSAEGRPRGAYVDLPADTLHHQEVSAQEAEDLLGPLDRIITYRRRCRLPPPPPPPPPTSPPLPPSPSPESIQAAVALLASARRPLVVVGKGAAYARAEDEVRALLAATGCPALATPMGKGVFPDSYDRSASAARSLAIKRCDVALVIGARLNWILHFGLPPKWDENVKFVLVDIHGPELSHRNPALGLEGDAKVIVRQLVDEIAKRGVAPLPDDHPWVAAVQEKARSNVQKMERVLAKDVVPMNFHCSLRVIRDAIKAVGSPSPIIISEGANTMDVSRTVIEHEEPRTKLDAGTWGTMGVGIGYAIGAAVANPDRLVIAIEGDSAFGFSAMEVEVLVRYQLPVVVFVMNNGGVYGGDRRPASEKANVFESDPAPTAFVPDVKYEMLMRAFGGKGYVASTAQELAKVCKEAFAAREPALVNVIIDPFAGSESGRLHSMN